jgi:hypothetical protein
MFRIAIMIQSVFYLKIYKNNFLLFLRLIHQNNLKT